MATNLFTKLFKKKARAADPLSCDVLTATSPLATPPAHGLVPLWTHQRAMLHRCMSIEAGPVSQVKVQPTNAIRYSKDYKPTIESYRIGIMNDPPGCGKTYVALALMALSPTASTDLNVVIVPENLHHQWLGAVDTYFPQGTFKCMSIKEYGHLHRWESATTEVKRTVRMLLTTSTLAERLTGTLRARRVIIDEVDSSTEELMTIPSCDQVWFISASFDVEKHKRIGAFDLSGLEKPDIRRLVCRCDVRFMQDTKELMNEEPVTKILQIRDGDIALFSGLLGASLLMYLNAHNVQRLKVSILADKETRITTVRSLADAFLVEKTKELERMTEDRKGVEAEAKAMGANVMDIDRYWNENEARMNKIAGQIKCVQTNMARVPTGAGGDKIDVIDGTVCGMIQGNGDNTPSKWIFFSDDGTMFDLIAPVLERHGILYRTMMGGTMAKNEAALLEYKTDPAVQVLFLNSMKDGCGLNLENTTHVLFLHYTNPAMVEQVIGRAQRPGRTSVLNIVCLYYANEVPTDVRANA